MPKTISAKTLVEKHVTRRDRVLLLNPPVEETRYSWVRWNQPLDLLYIGAHLRTTMRCKVELIDCMTPDDGWHVPESPLPRDRRYYVVKDERYPMRRFGISYEDLSKKLLAMQKRPKPERPTQVWIASLCSFWHESVAQACRVVKHALPDAVVVLLGQYPRLMPRHAADTCAADFVVTKTAVAADVPPALDLYGDAPPPFLALQLRGSDPAAEVAVAVAKGIFNFTVFDDDLCRDDGEALREVVEKTKALHKHVRYHFICGLHPARVNQRVAQVLADRQVLAAHFEEASIDGELDVPAYERLKAYLAEAGVRDFGNRLSGFVWIGRPSETLEGIVLRTFRVLECLEGVILKPFSPTPGSAEYEANLRYLEAIPHRELSPHFFPFAELNNITRTEYHDLYRMAAFLNEKVRDKSFDFLKGTVGAQMLRESLRREVWKLEPSPLRIAD
jgi:hypothetical protein